MGFSRAWSSHPWRRRSGRLLSAIMLACGSTLLIADSDPLRGQTVRETELPKATRFIGRWTNVDPQQANLPGAVSRLEIHANENTLFVKAWGRCRPIDCDWGEESVEMSAAEDGEFALTWRTETAALMHKISLAGDQLRIERQTFDADNSEVKRSPYVAHFLKYETPKVGQSLLGAPEGVRNAASSIGVVLREDVPGKPVVVASGFFLVSDLLVTSFEAVRSAERLKFRLTGSDTPYPVSEVLHLNEEKKFALLKVTGINGWPLPVWRGVIAGGIDVFVISNSRGSETSFSRGILNNTVNLGTTDQVEITSQVVPTDVGSPVLNKRGEVIGVLTSVEGGAEAFQAVRVSTVLGSARQTLSVSGDRITRPVIISLVKPSYTKTARDNKVTGSVVMRVLVGADGIVKDVRIVRGLPDGLNEEAVKSMYGTRFKPATRNGQPIDFWITSEATFNLR